MQKYFILVITILLLISLNIQINAQNSDISFYNASKFYIDGMFLRAEEEIRKGLQINPDDLRLKALQDLIEEEKQNQADSQPSEDQTDEDNQGSNEGEAGKEKQEEKQEEKQDGDQNKEQQKEEQGQNIEENKDKMSKEDAERILEALKNDEQDKQKLRKPIKGGKRAVDKDW